MLEAIAALADALSIAHELLTRHPLVVKLGRISPKLDNIDPIKRDTVTAQARLWIDRYLDIDHWSMRMKSPI